MTYLTADQVKIVDAGESNVIYADRKRGHGISTLSWMLIGVGSRRRSAG